MAAAYSLRVLILSSVFCLFLNHQSPIQFDKFAGTDRWHSNVEPEKTETSGRTLQVIGALRYY